MPYTVPNNKFVFTLHHWTQADWDYLKSLCEGPNRHPNVSYLKVAQEKGGEGVTPHLQGCVLFDRTFKRQRPPAISKLLMGPNKDVRLPDPDNEGSFLRHHYYHVDGMRGTVAEAADYCGNVGKENGCEVYEYGSVPILRQGNHSYEDAMPLIKKYAEEGMTYSELEDIFPRFAAKSPAWLRKQYLKHRVTEVNFFDDHKLWQWQERWRDYLRDKEPHPRKIIFMVDKTGNIGKSEFVRHAQTLIPNKIVFTMAPRDVQSMSSLIPDDGADVILIDAPRQVQYDLPYSFIEECKNGFVTNTKYEVNQKKFKTPHLLIFMNRNPKFGSSILSEDRYLIVELDLTPEEKERRDSTQTDFRDELLDTYMARTKEIREEAVAVQKAKQAEQLNNY
jgi:hypothetical protein